MEFKDIAQGPIGMALESLERAMLQPKNEFSRDSVVQRFEYMLELSWKLLKKYLEAQGLQTQTPKDCIRQAAQAGWLLLECLSKL